MRPDRAWLKMQSSLGNPNSAFQASQITKNRIKVCDNSTIAGTTLRDLAPICAPEDAMGEKPLMEKLFSSGVMQMGPSRIDPQRQVGIFNPGFLAGLPMRAAEMERFRWIEGEWDHENSVPATAASPAYTDVGKSRFALDAKREWVCAVALDGSLMPQITFDQFSRQWVYVLMRGAYGMLRSAEGWTGDSIAFTGTMTMLGPTREWRMRWSRDGTDRFSFVNEEKLDGVWTYVDQWRFTRRG
jgi:hypothetical protein